MSSGTDRTAGRLLRCFPQTWRSRYGAELEALIVDMTGDGSVSWRVRLNVVGAGVRERVVSAFGRQQEPKARVLGGTVQVLWAWTLFVLGGSIVGKSAEHWSDAVPGGPSAVSTTAYGALTAGAVGSAVLVLAGGGWGLRQFVAFLRAGGWPLIRGRVLVAGALSVLTAGATVGLVVLAGWMDEGHHVAPGAARGAFVGWAGLGAVCLCSWAAAAAATARRLDFSATTLRVESWLASGVSTAMAVVTVAAAVWWLTVARVAPGALTGGSAGGQAQAVVPELAVALTLMVLATAAGAVGARRAVTARRVMDR